MIGGRRLSTGAVLGGAALLLAGGALLGGLAGRLAPRSGRVVPEGSSPVVIDATSSPLSNPTGPLPVLGEVPDFTLIASDGAAFGRADLMGRAWAVDFIFTTCAGICPKMSSALAGVQSGLPDGLPATLVSISVDPTHDTPDVLAAYGRRYGADPDRWVFLTGEAEAIYSLARDGFHLGAGPNENPTDLEGPFLHSRRVVLVDAHGRIRGYYDGTEVDEVGRLGRDLRRVTAYPD